jgi:DNA-binding transcriptional regulator YiaG
MTLGTKIQELRKKQSLSQEAFAEIMDVTRQSVSKWELDQSCP